MRTPTTNDRDRGFSLIELLVVIAIIGVLSTIATFATLRARELAREAKAKEDLRTIATAIGLLAADTFRWPNGCPIESTANPEAYIDAAQAGLVSAPTVGNQGGSCQWTATDIANWRGPYVSGIVDPWGNKYYYDPDFVPYQNCPSQTAKQQTVALVSFGPNGVGPNAYDCDDIWFELR
jgi:prepilin-type N-terminal cleavage/methylation domain-containing protein